MIYVLSLYVFGMLLVRHCGQSQIVTMLCGLYNWNYNTVRQRLRELTYEGSAKRGKGRTTLDVQSCFAPLLSWVLDKFRGNQSQVVLALDATYLKDRFVILAVSVVVAGCAIPVAWHIRRADQKGKWNPIWISLLSDLTPVIPHDWAVFMLTDSGLYSKPLFKFIQNQGWYPMMRIEGSQGFFQAISCSLWYPIRQFAYEGMPALCIQGNCFKGDPLTCTLVVQWATGCKKPCILVTSLPPEQIQHNTYAIRYWIECGFKDVKSGLFHWEQTKMTCPKRAERLWLVISIALLWLTTTGVAAHDLPQWQTLPQPPSQFSKLSAPLLGWIHWLCSLLNGQLPEQGYLHPYAWTPLPDT